PSRFGEHADRAGSAVLVVRGQTGRIGDLGHGSLGGAGPLHLGDDGDRIVLTQHVDGVLGGRLRLGAPLELIQGDRRLPGGQVLPDPTDDFFQYRHDLPLASLVPHGRPWARLAGTATTL